MSPFDVESTATMAKDVDRQTFNNCEPSENSEEKFVNTTLQPIQEEQNNNASKLDDEKCQSDKPFHENNETRPVCTKLDDDVKQEEMKQKSAGELAKNTKVTFSENIEKCDENESNSRLPGFHQAFGSTEIGRFVHQKDFIEQINQQTSFIPAKPSSIFSIPCSSTSNTNSIISTNNSKIKSRYNKRLKIPAHSLPPPPTPAPPPSADLTKNVSSWNSYDYDAESSTNFALNFQSSNNGSSYYNKYRDQRTKQNQHVEGSSPLAYCNREEHYNYSSSYYYGNGCSDNMNCDYYRHPQNSSYYHDYSAYSNLHTGYFGNGYQYAKEHNERYNSLMNGDMVCSMNQNCQADKYCSSYNEEQFGYHYDKQSNNSSTYHHYQPYMSHNQHQLPPQQTYNNYNNYNSYTPISSFTYY